MDRFWEKIFK